MCSTTRNSTTGSTRWSNRSQPGETVQLTFEVNFEPHGFSNEGADASVVANGTLLHESELVAGHRVSVEPRTRCCASAKAVWTCPTARLPVARRCRGAQDRAGGDPVAFEAIVGTSGDQIAVAPGALRRTWTEGPRPESRRRSFHYVADVPIDNRYAVFSASYAVHEEQWHGAGQAVAIQIFHHPGHTETLGRMVASVRASLDYYTRQFGPYPYSYLRLIESPALRRGVTKQQPRPLSTVKNSRS